MNTLTVTHAFSYSGNYREYYWVKEIHLKGKEPRYPKDLLICSQDEGVHFGTQWYRATNDGIWYEPECLLKRDLTILTVEGEILREPVT